MGPAVAGEHAVQPEQRAHGEHPGADSGLLSTPAPTQHIIYRLNGLNDPR